MSAVYSRNKSGPRTLPWGTPDDNAATMEVIPLKMTCCVLPVKNDANHERTVPVNPNELSSRWSRIWWSTVSNAADMSRSPSNVTLPSSAAAKMSDITLRTAVSVDVAHGSRLSALVASCFLPGKTWPACKPIAQRIYHLLCVGKLNYHCSVGVWPSRIY